MNVLQKDNFSGHIRYFLACLNYFRVLLDVTICAYLKTCTTSNHICEKFKQTFKHTSEYVFYVLKKKFQ